MENSVGSNPQPSKELEIILDHLASSCERLDKNQAIIRETLMRIVPYNELVKDVEGSKALVSEDLVNRINQKLAYLDSLIAESEFIKDANRIA